jgi:hypothetical protein
MNSGLYDNRKEMRRELWLEWQGKSLFFGWCHVIALKGSSFPWEPQVPFGSLPDIK